eukprot:gnl/Dysnectes_brevis/1032_a1151_4615.p1 GENE.gnl/Dysnectes_brevis/1032_a1151_4615~~gnl/Dysnectes_brevis/1032_a1151_4615.p1  ORF type:complete len:110 (+),score=2.01 gnl/Dysnectes_brevis/1032_a1151_4615:29-331(+)
MTSDDCLEGMFDSHSHLDDLRMTEGISENQELLLEKMKLSIASLRDAKVSKEAELAGLETKYSGLRAEESLRKHVITMKHFPWLWFASGVCLALIFVMMN